MENVPYTSIIGSLMYVMVCTRINITYVVGFMGSFMKNIRKGYWKVVKWILGYLNGTTTKSLNFKSSNTSLQVYVD